MSNQVRNIKQDQALDLVWGIRDIAKFIGRTERQAFYMASEGKIPVKQVGGRWVASKQKLVDFFMGDAA
ncbi:DNA-binding protein [Ochrobactrum quorumnocens]|uniref:DNA-binding protein n=1 Tax=Ochrobactrum quorumnocens TaxID=271865 RepID=A0A5N1K6N7_9HYPH|nr:DNA-binding protein [[Ochrobactrum] quorumnocens]KAA9370928.1 DNA-binding protein [[Ochrobactrum] quorumnocens]